VEHVKKQVISPHELYNKQMLQTQIKEMLSSLNYSVPLHKNKIKKEERKLRKRILEIKSLPKTNKYHKFDLFECPGPNKTFRIYIAIEDPGYKTVRLITFREDKNKFKPFRLGKATYDLFIRTPYTYHLLGIDIVKGYNTYFNWFSTKKFSNLNFTTLIPNPLYANVDIYEHNNTVLVSSSQACLEKFAISCDDVKKPSELMSLLIQYIWNSDIPVFVNYYSPNNYFGTPKFYPVPHILYKHEELPKYFDLRKWQKLSKNKSFNNWNDFFNTRGIAFENILQDLYILIEVFDLSDMSIIYNTDEE